METQDGDRVGGEGTGLETFLVEWKHSKAYVVTNDKCNLETFLVEWKPASVGMTTCHAGSP